MTSTFRSVLIFAPESPHTAKFINMIDDDIQCHPIIIETGISSGIPRPYDLVSQRSIAGIFKIISAVRRCQLGCIHVHSINFTAFLVALFATKPIILTAWGSDVLLVPSRSFIHKAIIRFILRKAKVVSSNDSPYMVQAIKALTPEIEVKKVHFGVSKYCISPQEATRKENIIYSPRGHAPLYNIDKIIMAFREFYKTNPGWKLVIAGQTDAHNTPKLYEMSKGMPIRFVGFTTQEQNADFLRRAKIMVSIPSSDALSVSLMEGIYSNCICFVSNLLPNQKVIKHGVNGFLGDPDFRLYEEIDFIKMAKTNGKRSKMWNFAHNKKRFLSLYIR